MKTPLTKEQQAAAAIAAKIINTDELSEFFDRVQQRLDLYDEQKPVVEPRPKRHS